MPGKKVLSTSTDFKLLNQAGDYTGTIDPPDSEKAKNAVTMVNFQFTDGSLFDFNAGSGGDSPVGSEYCSFFVSQGVHQWAGDMNYGPTFTECENNNASDAVLVWKGNRFSFQGKQAREWYMSAIGEVNAGGRSCNLNFKTIKNFKHAVSPYAGGLNNGKGSPDIPSSYSYTIELRDIPFRRKSPPEVWAKRKGVWYSFSLSRKQIATHVISFDIRYKEGEKNSKVTGIGYEKDTLVFEFFKLVK